MIISPGHSDRDVKKKIVRYYVTDLGNGATNAVQAQLLLVKAFVQS